MSSPVRLRSGLELRLLLLLAVTGLVLQGGSVPHTHADCSPVFHDHHHAHVLQGGSVPHTHAECGPGLYNHDHDLVLLAALHGAAVLADVAPPPLVVVLVAALAILAIRTPASAPRSTCDSRAPPRA